VDVLYSHKDVRVPSDFAKVDTIMHAPSEITIRGDGTWRLDFEGSSRPAAISPCSGPFGQEETVSPSAVSGVSLSHSVTPCLMVGFVDVPYSPEDTR
jgi:hypothetical protein